MVERREKRGERTERQREERQRTRERERERERDRKIEARERERREMERGRERYICAYNENDKERMETQHLSQTFIIQHHARPSPNYHIPMETNPHSPHRNHTRSHTQ